MKSDTSKSIVREFDTPKEQDKLAQITNNLEKIAYFFSEILHKVSSVALFAMMILTTCDVIGRYFFNQPVTGTYELTGLFLSIIVFLSLGKTQLWREHIEIDVLTKRLPLKIRESIHAFGSFLLTVLLIVTTGYTTNYAWRVGMSGETSGDLQLPLFIFILFAVIGLLCFTLTMLVKALHSTLLVVSRDES
ncbi:hypothetical protein CHL76_14715 [Marinococcus halophilus]|uniref:Tripartite ATP-independent periplasmic transporters DctQ component domain-containing protein n=1 Tax=Marinococcus halophilus TaxID=1371 RepID=A0A510YC40_MARHA|nr:TRAP transporter small permease [Marinococcus halophilus]OZT79069.1 hypothetical protein CHL76_14715 [Marinococcus halophilus]GEK59947.1 hypothetical protein MHA01_28520 [Marinococcus halophilus]